MAINKQTFQLTQDGVDKYKEELKELVEVKRQENLEALKEARAQGDLSENADYDAARNEQARIEGRIAEIENILKNARIIKAPQSNLANIGKTVRIRYVESGKEKEFYLISSLETDPKNNRISIESPIGRALLDKQKGDVIDVKSGTGRIFKIEILEIK